MNSQKLIDTAGALVAGDKGLLVMDAIHRPWNQRFAYDVELLPAITRLQ